MIQEAVKQWDLHKEELRKYLQTHEQSEYDSYEKLFRIVVELILNAEGENNMNLNLDCLTIIDDGDYQGTKLFILPRDTCLPSDTDYYVSHNYYGSCSGCDTLLSISDYESGLPTEEQVNEYMTLCLHQIQRLKRLYEDECN